MLLLLLFMPFPPVTYHLEVLSGVVEAAKPFYKDVVVYVEPFTANGNLGWRKLVADYPGRILRTPTPGPHVLLPRHDVLFFVSPECVGVWERAKVGRLCRAV